MSLESEIKPRIKTIKSLMNGASLLEVSENLLNLNTEDIWMQKAAKGLKQGSPTSAFIIWDQCKRAKELNLKDVFQYELDLAIQVTRHPDFTEGIRAAIIEKDNQPQWKYEEIKNVPEEWVIEHLEPAWDVNPLSNL
jgi:enoyl-CoA hydratase/carnithine racemase